jgi:glycosyltransferase involved in cell wall biosynthesis
MCRWSRQLAQHRYVADADVVYTVAYRAHVAARLAGLGPVVWHVHSFPPDATRRIWRAAARHRPARLIANSSGVADAWRPGLAHADDRLRVVHNGVNLDRFLPRERTGWIHDRLGLPRSHRLIGMPSLLARWKGHLETLNAFERVTAEFPDVHFVIVGGTMYDTDEEAEHGDELKRVTGEFRVVTSGTVQADGGAAGKADEPAAARSDASPGAEAESAAHARVHMLPFQREIELAYPEFDLTVHYSLRPEPFGRVVLESIACGVPVIAAGEGGPVEILGPGNDPRRCGGWLVEPRHTEALANTMRQALRLAPDELRAIGAAGRIRAEDHFSSRAFAARIAAVLKEARDA